MTPKNLRLKLSRCLFLLGLFAIPGAVAGPTLSAQIDPRSIGTVMLAASGPTELIYYREAYPGTDCTLMSGAIACFVQGLDDIDKIYFPDPSLRWL